MDPRRFVILAGASLLLSGCALFRAPTPSQLVVEDRAASVRPVAVTATEAPPRFEQVTEPVEGPPMVPPASGPTGGRPYLEVVGPSPDGAGDPEDAAGSERAEDHVVGQIHVFAWSEGRVYPVRTAPLRVTTLTLGDGETLVAKAAGDTVRWQIGEVVSGEGLGRRTHVLLKPLERGLETNLVLTTNRRVYLVELKSGSVSDFNPAVAWEGPAVGASRAVVVNSEPIRVSDPVVMPQGPLDARYRVETRGRSPRWTPTAVFNDGHRTFITFDPDLQVDEAPALFVIAPDGEAQLVNYRQAGGLFIVDRVFDQAELRLGDRRPQVVRIRRIQGGRS
jgi:P-type conjugative transfer protein TrbG